MKSYKVFRHRITKTDEHQAKCKQGYIKYLSKQIIFEVHKLNLNFMEQDRHSSWLEQGVAAEQSSNEHQSPFEEHHSRSFKDGHWNQDQIFKFISYLVFNRQTLKLKLQRRTNKVFKQMSDFIGTRTSVQCRSQNQRLFRKFKNFRTIVSSFKDQYGRDRFETDYRQISKLPGIRFRTQLEKMAERQEKVTIEQATQTQEIVIPKVYYPQPFTHDSYLTWRHDYWNMLPNIMMPYY